MGNDLDLNAIAEFMNEPVESDIDANEVENTLDYINTQLSNVPKAKELTTVEQVEQHEHTIDELTNIALNITNSVDNHATEIYDLFYKPLALGKDRTDASKVALVDSQRLRVELINSLANLANAKAKLEMAKAKVSAGNTGIFVNTQPGSDVGISLHNLWESEK